MLLAGCKYRIPFEVTKKTFPTWLSIKKIKTIYLFNKAKKAEKWVQMSFDGPFGSIKRHEIKGPSKDMRFLGPSKDMRF
jgi:hypothetical protein